VSPLLENTMNIAFLFQQRVLACAARQIRQWIAGTPAARKGLQTQSTAPVFAPDLIAAHAHSTGAARQKHINSAVRPLRVVRVVDAGQNSGSVGRMVISGRMADVCAELDRLAAREAALV